MLFSVQELYLRSVRKKSALKKKIPEISMKCQYCQLLSLVSSLGVFLIWTVVSVGIRASSESLESSTTSNTPQQIHISIGNKETNIVIMWSTMTRQNYSVEYRPNESMQSRRQSSNTYEVEDQSEQALKFIYRAELEDLKPGGRYDYKIVSTDSPLMQSKFQSFEVSSKVKKNHCFMVFADMGLQTHSLSFIIEEAINKPYSAILHIGDIAYNLNSEGGNRGDHYMQKVEKFASKVPYMTTPGDHERFDSFFQYRYRFSMPGSSFPMKLNELWYSFNIGLTHFISLNAEPFLKDIPLKAEQLQWLKNDLKLVNKNRSETPWIVVQIHKPVYCTKSVMEQECQKEFSALRDSLEDLFFAEGVDLVLSGHKHCYERSWPIYKSQAFQNSYFNPTAPVYITVGTLGYAYLADRQLSQPKWLALAIADGRKEMFARMNVTNSTHLIWTMHDATSNDEVDTVWLIQQQHGSFGDPSLQAELANNPNPNAFDYSNRNFPPEPFRIIDMPSTSFLSMYRKYILLSTVTAMVFILFLLLRYRHGKIRKVFRA